MKVTYIYHSGFAVELEKSVLLFDYCEGELPQWGREKAVYVFASHKHKDHFTMKVLELDGKYENVRYIFGNDIKLNGKYLERKGIPASIKEKIITVGKGKTLECGGLWIRTFRSTDAGVAFAVYTEGRLLYHAGDLNWWHWKGEPSSWNEAMERDYKREMDSLKGMFSLEEPDFFKRINPPMFDVAFVPLDPRLEEAYGWGMDYFLEHVGAKYVFPMHMWEEYGIIDRYKETQLGKKRRDWIMDIREAGQEFKLWNISYLC